MNTLQRASAVVARAAALIDSARPMNPVAASLAAGICATAKQAIAANEGLIGAMSPLGEKLFKKADGIAGHGEIPPSPRTIARVAVRAAASSCCLALMGFGNAATMDQAETWISSAEASMDLARLFDAPSPTKIAA